MRVKDALEETRHLPPQTKVEIVTGMHLRRNKGGICIPSIHYSANPDRDPDINPAWRREERGTYTSQADWDREQEMIDEAGGGRRVFAEVLSTHWKKIVIEDPLWRPGKTWKMVGGFDYGKTNPTCLLRCYVDYDGVLYFCGEYYMPGKEIWQHAPEIKKMADVNKFSECWADPSIFPNTQEQSKTKAKSNNELYIEQGIELFAPFSGDRNDVSFAERLLAHWSRLDEREPTVKIVCPNTSEKQQPGRHDWSCPNLIWELLRTRTKKLSAIQLMQRNPTEEIVDKDNHARDAMKYTVMSMPEPTVKTMQEIAAEAVKGLDATSAMIRYQQMMEKLDKGTAPVALGRRGLRLRR